jgi:hypothetical protein
VEAVIFVGLQGAGKSTFYRERFFATHMRINLDMLKTRHREGRFLQVCIESRQPFVVDNTNLTRAERQVYIDLSRSAFLCKAFSEPQVQRMVEAAWPSVLFTNVLKGLIGEGWRHGPATEKIVPFLVEKSAHRDLPRYYVHGRGRTRAKTPRRKEEKTKRNTGMTENEIAKIVVDACYHIHTRLGPGLISG